jgi:tetratricopeptide (TPR) repeat protein
MAATQVSGFDAGFENPEVNQLEPGTLLAERYEVQALLGQGGMGAVYKAWDRELDRMVAIKTIRPELAAQRQILDRFKQEVVLTSQIAHNNVVRIYDLGTAGALRFLTMEFVEGRMLNDIMRERRLPPEECAAIIREVCLGLAAAHAKNVIHRDLKPHNVMVDSKGRVAVMDFGLAHSMENAGMTRTGVIMGTPDYMSPEQAMGQRADHRSDIFSLGVILFEMLTGQVPFPSETMVGALVARTREKARPPVEIDPDVPESLNAIVSRCMEMDPAARYQTVDDVIADLDAHLGLAPTPRTSVQTPMPTVLATPLKPPAQTATSVQAQAPGLSPASRRKWIAAGAAGTVGLAAGTYFFRDRLTGGGPVRDARPVSVLVADFANKTTDPGFDDALEPSFSLGLEGASFINIYSRGTAKRVGARLREGATKLDENLARLVAMREGISVIAAGAIRMDGSRYVVSVKAVDAVTGKTIVEREETAGARDKVLQAAASLSVPVRRALGDNISASARLSAAETYTASSLPAAQAYSRAQDLRFAGEAEKAIVQFLEAIRIDQNLGSAYYSLASTYTNLGQREQADKYYKLALARLDQMTQRERYRTRGGYYLMQHNHEKAFDEFSALVEGFPADTGGLINLAYVYYLRRDMRKGLELITRALQIYPKVPLYRSNYAMYLMYTGDFPTAAREAQSVIDSTPSYLKAYNTLALAQLGQGQPGQARETYRKLAAINTRGASFAAMGEADVALYEGNTAAAVELLAAGIKTDLEAKSEALAAKKSAVLARALLLAGKKGDAVAAADRAAAGSREVMPLFAAAMVYVEAGLEAKALSIGSDLGRRLESDPQMYALLIEGEIELKRSKARQAISKFAEAQKLTDTWLGRMANGRAYLAAGGFPEANSEFEACLKRRGEAVELFLDETQTYHYFPAAYYYLARTQEGLGSSGAIDTYRQFIAMKAKESKDPLLADAIRRAGKQ